MNDEFADFGGSGESDLVDLRMRGECGSGSLSESGDDVDDPVRETGFDDEFAEQQSGEGRLFRRLEDDSVASSERGTKLPRGHEEREVPGNDLSHYADWLAHCVSVIARSWSVRNG